LKQKHSFCNIDLDVIKPFKRRDIMNKEKFLTRQWNNWLTLAMGLPTLAYAFVVLSTSILSDFMAFIGMILLGAVY
jgi:hypothetical protein